MHLNEMHDWHYLRGIHAMHGRNRRDVENRQYVTWRFVIPEVTESFRDRFGALRILDVPQCASAPY